MVLVYAHRSPPPTTRPKGAAADEIWFNIPVTNSGHHDYQDDGVAGQVTRENIATTTEADDANILGIDPDFAKSWYSIQLSSALSTVTDAVVIDGTTQAGYTDSSIIELDGSMAGTELPTGSLPSNTVSAAVSLALSNPSRSRFDFDVILSCKTHRTRIGQALFRSGNNVRRLDEGSVLRTTGLSVGDALAVDAVSQADRDPRPLFAPSSAIRVRPHLQS
jgi:hypothetical protein